MPYILEMEAVVSSLAVVNFYQTSSSIVTVVCFRLQRVNSVISYISYNQDFRVMSSTFLNTFTSHSFPLPLVREDLKCLNFLLAYEYQTFVENRISYLFNDAVMTHITIF
jgi:hypothetical protein